MKKYTLEYVGQYFKDHDCKLLEEEYKNNSTKMKYMCSCGNISEISFASFKKGSRCKKCGTKRGSEKLKFTLEHVEQYFEEHNCKLLETEYINCDYLMAYKCNCGNISKISFYSFKQGIRCNKCGTKRAAEKHRLTLEYVEQCFKDGGCKLLEKEYINNYTLMKYKCFCGNISKISFSNFRKGASCSKCGNHKELTLSRAKQYFLDHNCTLLENSCKNSSTLMKYICSCGNVGKTTFNNFQQRHRCKKCAIKRIKGKNHYNYNPNLTDEDREKNRMNDPLYYRWRKRVFVRDDYTCQKCFQIGGNLNAHHIKNYSTNKSLRLIGSNGVTFCVDCHKDFHHIYGYKNNNRQQLEEFLTEDKLIFSHT